MTGLFDHLDQLPAVQTPTGGGTIQERFERFHRLNPFVADALERLVEQMLATGKRKVGIRRAWEVLRWELDKRTTGDQGFALNDSLHSRYARLLIERRPEWREVFELRRLRAK